MSVVNQSVAGIVASFSLFVLEVQGWPSVAISANVLVLFLLNFEQTKDPNTYRYTSCQPGMTSLTQSKCKSFHEVHLC